MSAECRCGRPHEGTGHFYEIDGHQLSCLAVELMRLEPVSPGAFMVLPRENVLSMLRARLAFLDRIASGELKAKAEHSFMGMKHISLDDAVLAAVKTPQGIALGHILDERVVLGVPVGMALGLSVDMPCKEAERAKGAAFFAPSNIASDFIRLETDLRQALSHIVLQLMQHVANCEACKAKFLGEKKPL
jgi:hypothetical protein